MAVWTEYSKVFNMKLTLGKDGKMKLIVTMKPKYKRLVKIAIRTRSWKSKKRLSKRILKAIGNQTRLAELYAKGEKNVSKRTPEKYSG